MNFKEIETLAQLSKEGDPQSKERLLKEFTPFILNLAKKSYVNGYDFEDLRNECFITLFKCVDIYNPNKHRFVAYAINAIKNSMNTLIRNSVRRDPMEGSKTLILEDNLEHVLFYHMDFIEEKLYKTYFNSMVKEAIKNLSYPEQDLINYVFYKNYSLRRYANFRDIPYKKAYNTKTSLLNKLKLSMDKEDYLMDKEYYPMYKN